MKNLLFSLVLLCTASAFAQEKEYDPTVKSPSKFSFGWVYSPEVSYRMLTEGSEANQTTDTDIQNQNKNELAKFGQSASLFVGYKLSDLFTLEGGIGYTNFGVSTLPKHVHYIGTENDPEVIYDTYWIRNLHVLSVPIRLNTSFGQNRLKGFFSAGVTPGYLVEASYTVHREYENGDLTEKTSSTINDGEYSRFILGATLSAGIDYHFSSAASLRVAPVFRMTANSVFADNEIRGHYFNAGINLGLIYNL